MLPAVPYEPEKREFSISIKSVQNDFEISQMLTLAGLSRSDPGGVACKF
jgi:hypothetical protein